MMPTRSRCAHRCQQPGSVGGWIRLFLLTAAVLLGTGGDLEAQAGARLAVSDTLLEIRLTNGEQYVGTIVAAEADSVTLQAASGTRIRLARTQIVGAVPARGAMRGAAFWPEDPNRTRLFFSPTGRSLRRGDGYFGVYELFIPFVAYGVTDRFILAGGSPFYLAFTGDVTPPVYIAPKFELVRAGRFHGSLGGLALIIPDDGEETYTLGILYGVGTYGDSDNAITAGLGWGYVEDEIASQPVAMIGGETRLGRYTKLMTENVFAPGEDGVIVSGGVRFFGSRLSADAGLIGLIGSEGECCFPLVNFVYNFGGGR